jgi:hypothetical protein
VPSVARKRKLNSGPTSPNKLGPRSSLVILLFESFSLGYLMVLGAPRAILARSAHIALGPVGLGQRRRPATVRRNTRLASSKVREQEIVKA